MPQAEPEFGVPAGAYPPATLPPRSRRRPVITSDFAGAAAPPGSRVRFRARGRTIAGVVSELQLRRAVVAAGGEGRWKVPYGRLEVLERGSSGECALGEVEALAHRLIGRHQAANGLAREWRFGFALASARAGACNERDQTIELSVSYCLRASRAAIRDTLLHEIAHAIVGVAHRHDAVWKAKAREIGCSGDRCHRVSHTVARWIGRCGCRRHFRQRLHHRLRRGALCARCHGPIEWRINSKGES